MTFSKPTSLLIALAFLVLTTTAQAQINTLTNPDFATDLSGWSVFEGRVATWSDLDADGSGSSGSALLSNQGASTGNVPLVLHQCVMVQSGIEYQFGGDLRVPENQPAGTTAYIFIQYFSTVDCTGNSPQPPDDVSSNTVGSWVGVSEALTVPAGTQSLRIGLGIFKNIGQSGDAQAYYDNVFLLAPDPAHVEPSKAASWYNPDESGHGIMIHLLDANTAWMCWFTFDLDGNPAWICALGVIDGDTITFDEAFTIDGGAFPPNFDPDLIEEIPWGSVVVVFSGCNAGTMTWTTNAAGFQSGEMPIVRLTSSWGSTCPEG